MRTLPPDAMPRLRRPAAGMDILDAAPWAGGVSFLSCGVRFGVRSTDPELLTRLAPFLPPDARPSSRPVDFLYSLYSLQPLPGLRGREGLLRLYAERYLSVEGEDAEEILDRLRSLIEVRVARFTPRRLFVHAGVVGWRGMAVLLPGRSGAGKSTLVAALVRAGARYYSDEFALLDEDGLVHPWPRRLRLRPPEGGVRHCPATELGGRTGRQPLPVGLVVATRHREGARWLPRVAPPGEAALGLLKNTVVAREQPARALRIVARAGAAAPLLRGARGEAADTAAAILARPELNGGR